GARVPRGLHGRAEIVVAARAAHRGVHAGSGGGVAGVLRPGVELVAGLRDSRLTRSVDALIPVRAGIPVAAGVKVVEAAACAGRRIARLSGADIAIIGTGHGQRSHAPSPDATLVRR